MCPAQTSPSTAKPVLGWHLKPVQQEDKRLSLASEIISLLCLSVPEQVSLLILPKHEVSLIAAS